MTVVWIIIPIAGLLSLAAVWAFIRATRAGQFDDLDTPGVRILVDDEPALAR